MFIKSLITALSKFFHHFPFILRLMDTYFQGTIGDISKQFSRGGTKQNDSFFPY